MEITENITKTYKLTDLDALDDITVMVEDHRPGEGEITIKCYGESWTAYWGSMGGKSIMKFFIGANTDYLIGKLAPQLQSQTIAPGQEYKNPYEEEVKYEPNKQWNYLERIILTVQDAFRQLLDTDQPPPIQESKRHQTIKS